MARCLALLLCLVSVTAGAAPSDTRCLAVLGTNDIHGALEPHTLEVKEKLRYGGITTLAAYVKILREQYGERVVLLDGGDQFQGTLTSNLSEGRAVQAAMNWLGYDAAAVGNHEFDYGAGMEWQAHSPGAEPSALERLTVVKQRVRDAKFPYLAVNVVEKATQKVVNWPNLYPSRLIEKGGIKVGLVGASTPDTPRVTRPQNVALLDFPNPVPSIIAEARRLRAQGAQIVVLVTHMGGDCQKLDDPNDLKSCDKDSELFNYIQAMPEGTLDVAVAGHTHAYVAKWVNGTAVSEASARARALGWIEACVDDKGKFSRAATTIHPPIELCLDTWADGTCKSKKGTPPLQPASFLGKAVVPSPELAKVLEPFAAQVAEAAARPIGIDLKTALPREAPDGSRPLGTAVCEAMRKVTGAAVAVQNLGGIRADLPAGLLSFQQVFEVLPFDNRVAVMDLTGTELMGFVGLLAERRQGDLPLTAGLIAKAGKNGPELRLSDGTPVDPKKTYRVATNDFLATGGEGLAKVFENVTKDEVKVLDADLREALIDYLKATSPAK